jgi:predicted O-methyltransferase YrrM
MHRFKIITSLIKERLKLKRGAEIGVWKGECTEYLLNHHKKLRMICVDPYEFYVHYDTYHNLAQYSSQEKLDKLCDKVRSRLRRKFGDRVRFIRKRSVEAAKMVEDKSLDFAFIDANYGHDYVFEDILAWRPKVRKGGVLIGQNIWSNKDGKDCVKRAVMETLGNCFIKGERWFYIV